MSASILIGLSTNSRQTDGRGRTRTDRRLSRECIPFLPGPSIPCFAVCTRAREGEAEKDTDREVCKWQGKETPFDARSLARSLSREGRMEGGSIVYTKPFPPSFLIARQSHSHSRVPRSAAAAMFSGGGAETDKCDRFTRHERQSEREKGGETSAPRRTSRLNGLARS